ncbi:hypothetical protein B0H14DRAFT_3472031 [Mycena olivaceomarginata]|nr:hypothetical protein B0H14DRAFT_3472031 [Mycena olivaceomarginata]
MYPASSAVEFVGKPVHEASIWEQAIRPDSVATAYLAGWMADIAPYRNQPAENDEYLDLSPLHTTVLGSRQLSDDDLTEC